MSLNIQVSGPNGPFYKTRDGRRVRIFTTDVRDNAFTILGAVDRGGDKEEAKMWTASGACVTHRETPSDLIAIWTDAPEVDWSPLPPEAKSIAMDESGGWFAYRDEARADNGDHIYYGDVICK